jgi:SsrA-binding protein
MSLVEHRKAKFTYTITEHLEGGLELLGFEVKSLRKGQGSLEGSYVVIRGGEAFLIGMTIPPFQTGNTPKDYDLARNRKILLTKAELHSLAGTDSQKGLTIVPLSVYNKGRKIKIELGIARGKKQFDKRESIKKRETDRDIRRTLKYE